MSTIIRLNHEHAKSDADLLQALNITAQKYNLFANQKLLFIYRNKMKDALYKSYEVFFGKENFIHLVGFKREYLNAVEFFEKCKNKTLNLSEVFFKENRKSASAKIDALLQLLDYKHVKIYRMGSADLIRQKNNFDVGLGNYSGIIGFSQRKAPPALPVPVTVMKRAITDYVSTPETVVAILKKGMADKYYNEVVGCANRGILMEELPYSIVTKIDPTLSYIIKNTP